MGKRQTTLREIVYRNYRANKHFKPSANDFQESEYWPEIEFVYKELSGKNATPPSKLGSWDIPTCDFIIELDEERHFNRYRVMTLEMPFYNSEINFDINRYKLYCEKHEVECLKAARWGKNWKNYSTEKLFGLSNGEGDLTMGGSSRWKQRAYNDFLRDVASRLLKVPVIRMSIYDSYQGCTLNNLLKAEQEIVILDIVKEITSIQI